MGKTAREILIREAAEKDVSAIYDIGCLCFSDAWRRETVHHDLMENEHSFYLVAEEDGFITGYGCFWFIAGEAQLVNIGVRPCCRRQGIAPYICGEAATFTPHSSLLIPHLGRAFIPNQGTSRPRGQP